MGSFLSGVLGTNSQYQPTAAQPGNPYSPQVLQEELNQQAQIYGGQQGLADQFKAQMSGYGPNPAQAQYLQNVQGNIANAQGMIAAQRGLNPALATRMGANIGVAANQEAARQAGIMQQQQQIAASQNLGALYGQMQQGNIEQQRNYVAPNTSAMQTNAAVANANQQAAQGIVGGIMGAIGSAATMAKAHGGMIERFAGGGEVGSKSDVANYLSGFSDMGKTNAGSVSPELTQGFGELGAMGANPRLSNGISAMFPKLPSKGDTSNLMAGGPGDAGGAPIPMVAAKGGQVKNFEPGGKVPGKAKVSGDSYSNDTVPAVVSPGEIVLPRSVTMGENAPEKARDFVAAVLAKKRRMPQ